MDYYDILELPRDANIDDVKKAYKKLALKYHPDKNKDKDAAQKFNNISEAYQVLSDSHKKFDYDNRHINNIVLRNPFELFNELFMFADNLFMMVQPIHIIEFCIPLLSKDRIERPIKKRNRISIISDDELDKLIADSFIDKEKISYST